MAESAIYVSMHFATLDQLWSSKPGQPVHTSYCVFELSRVSKVEQLSRTQSEDHAFIVLLQLIVNLRCDQGRKLSVREAFIFI